VQPRARMATRLSCTKPQLSLSLIAICTKSDTSQSRRPSSLAPHLAFCDVELLFRLLIMSTRDIRALAAHTQVDDDLSGDVSPLSEISEDRHATVDLAPVLYQTRNQNPENHDQRPVYGLPPVVPDNRPNIAGSNIGSAPDTQVEGRDSGLAQEPHQNPQVEVNDSRVSGAGNCYCGAGTSRKTADLT
jgi:hypothetical protein